MDRLIVCETDNGHYAVRPADWTGMWNRKGQIKESINHLGLFLRKEDAENFAKWKMANEQWRLLELPCAVGDTVYTNISMKGWYFRKENRPYEAKVAFIGINGANYMNVDFENGHMLQFKFSEIGKTVFLNKSEAEEALKKMNEREERPCSTT